MEQINPFFPVLRKPLFTDFAGEPVDVERDALLNGDNGGFLGTVGKVYKLVENQEVDRLFRLAFSGLPIQSTHDHLNWKENRWQRDFVLDGDAFNIVIGDTLVKTKISIWNGYDGKSSVGFSISAYQEDNNITYLSKMFGATYSHVHVDLVDRIRSDFDEQLEKFQNIKSLFVTWNRQSFTRESFESFVLAHVKTEQNRSGYLNERQAKAIVDSYESHLSHCGLGFTRWGAYNVLASIAANDFRGRGGSSNIFTAGYKRMERLSQDFFEFDGGDELFTI